MQQPPSDSRHDSRSGSRSGSTSGSRPGSQLDYGSSDGQPVAAALPEDTPEIASAKAMIGAYQKAARSLRLYPAHSSILQRMLADFATGVADHVGHYGETELLVHESDLCWGKHSLYSEPDRSKSLAFMLFVNGIRLIRLRPGIRRDEADAVVHVMTRALDRDATTDVLRTAIWEHAFDNVDFVISEDLFNAAEEQEYRQFEAEGKTDLTDAATVVASIDEVWAELDALPALPGEDAYKLDLVSRDELKNEAAEEAERELFDDLAGFLVAEFEGDRGAGVRTHIEGFLEHLVATGDILRAARILGTLRTRAGSNLNDERRKVVQDAVSKLAKTRIIPLLRPILPELSDDDRRDLFRLVTALGEPAIAPLCDLLDSEYKEPAGQALGVLAREFPKALLVFVQHPKGIVVRQCLELLGEHGDESVVSGIMPALRHSDVGVRREALRALKTLGGAKALDLFIKALDDPGYEVRSLAIAALGEFGGPRSARALLPRLEDKAFLSASDYEKRETFRALGLIGTPDVIVLLIRTLGTKSMLRRAKVDEMRALAASALALIDTPAARNALMKHRNDKSDPVRRAIAAALHSSSK